MLIPGNPVKLSKMAEGPETRVPWVGEHTAAVLQEELGLGAASWPPSRRTASSRRRERPEGAHGGRASASEPHADGVWGRSPHGNRERRTPSPTRASPGCGPASACRSRIRSRRTTCVRAPTRSGTSPSRTATTTRCGAIPAYGLKTRWDGPIAPPPLVGGDTLIGEDEVDRGRRGPARPHEGRSAARRARLLRDECSRVVGAAAPGPADLPAQRARRRARQAERVRRASGARMDRRRCSATSRTPCCARSSATWSAPNGPRRARRRSTTPSPSSRTPTTPSPPSRSSTRSETRRGAEPRWFEDVTRGRRDRADGEGAAHRHRHDLLARRHGHGPLRRRSPCGWRTRTGSASRASSTATTSTCPT